MTVNRILCATHSKSFDNSSDDPPAQESWNDMTTRNPEPTGGTQRQTDPSANAGGQKCVGC